MTQSETSGENRVFAVIAVALAALAVRCIWRTWDVLPVSAPFQYDYEEGNILNAFTLILRGATPWPNPRQLPSVMDPYGPVAYYLLVLPVKLFGFALVYPRAMIIGLVLLVAVLIAVELRRLTRSTILGMTFGLVYLTIPNIQEWGWLLRVDFLGIALTFAGLMVFERRLERDRSPVLLPALLFAAALLVKVTLVAAPAACFLVLLTRRRFRDAGLLAAVTAAPVVLVMSVFAAITHGAILIDVYMAHPDRYERRRFLTGFVRVVRESWPFLLLAAVAAADDVRRRRLSTPVAWFVIATPITLTAGAQGSNTNHFLEWNTALCLAGGVGMSKLVELRPRAIRLPAATAAAVALAFVLLAPRELLWLNGQSGCAAAYDWVRTQAGPNLLSENVGAVVLGGKRVWLSNPFAFAQMVEHYGWSDAELVRMVREHEFDAVVVRDPNLMKKYRRFTPNVLRAIAESYEPGPGFDCRDMRVIFTPKKASP
jgi:hypothetical protein